MTETTMTAAKAKELRKVFPAAAIGKLPKPYKKESPKGNCRECSGYHGLPAAHLDYVGHAAATDRLLSVDPSWTWRPFTTEEITALPPKLRDAGLWIHLTVCGVTRPGVGDGISAKECIGDAIRNSAMRFGVALDLWAKEDLHEIQAAQKGEPSSYDDAPTAPPPEHPADPPPATPAGKMSTKTRGTLFKLFDVKGVPEADQLSGVNHLNGTAHESRADITEAEALAVIKVLRTRPDADLARAETAGAQA